MKQFQSTTRPNVYKWERNGSVVAYQGLEPFNDEWQEVTLVAPVGYPKESTPQNAYRELIKQGRTKEQARAESGWQG